VVLIIHRAASGKPTIKIVLAEIPQLLALPGFWFAGPWITSLAMSSSDFKVMLPTYTTSLAITFTLVSGYPLMRLSIALGNRIGKVGVRT
jgi:hypothetical protein